MTGPLLAATAPATATAAPAGHHSGTGAENHGAGTPTPGTPPATGTYTPLPGAHGPGPGPATLDHVHVPKAGSARARQVLVLTPGQFAAAGSLAREPAAGLPDTQAWAVDRREQNLADLDGFRRSPDRAADHYLGGHYRKQTARTVPYVADWGPALELADLREVVLAARDGGRGQVVLGGHSWGATTALAYAGRDFGGHPGHRDLSGLVLLDGGVHDAFAGESATYRLTADQADALRARIAGGEVFDQSVTMGRTESFAILQQLAGAYAATAPEQPPTLAAHLPDPLRPPAGVPNAELLERLHVTHPLVPDLSINPACTPDANLARALAGPVPSVTQWYWPNRLTPDLETLTPFLTRLGQR
ncbi:alpha/beta fold hydrolase [Streptomyces sp. NBC_00096]|uniref:alpha/beta fold hydrolase n=1 Tax=Streptomyces sp. NBC_00096 TaxID=2975650 RepID=UPI0032490F11